MKDKSEFLSRLQNAKDEAEWTAICEEVKKDYNFKNSFPSWWYPEIILTGLASEKAKLFRQQRAASRIKANAAKVVNE